jgi:hypothetical protein
VRLAVHRLALAVLVIVLVTARAAQAQTAHARAAAEELSGATEAVARLVSSDGGQPSRGLPTVAASAASDWRRLAGWTGLVPETRRRRGDSNLNE